MKEDVRFNFKLGIERKFLCSDWIHGIEALIQLFDWCLIELTFRDAPCDLLHVMSTTFLFISQFINYLLVLEISFSSSFFNIINVNGEAVFNSSSSLLKFFVVKLMSAEAGDPHVSWLICQVLVSHLTRALLHNSIVEWLWLVELFSVLSSILISVGILFCGPACVVPEGWVHHVARTIIEECLSWSIQVCLVSDVLLEFESVLIGELLRGIAVLEHGRWLHLWINITGSESGLVWLILRVIMWMSLWHCLGAVSPWSGVERLISLWNPLGIESA